MAALSDLVVVGGGFYGLRIALHAREVLGAQSVIVLEREPEVMNRASFVNQARVHNGYHYPRSLLTAHRSRVNLPQFISEFGDAVVSSFDHHYAISRQLSKINARQFEIFCDRIGAKWERSTSSVAGLFNQRLIEASYLVEEPAFDSRVLRCILLDRIAQVGGIDVRTETEALHISPIPTGLRVETNHGVVDARRVISAVYSQINVLHRASGIPELPLQHEIAEMAIVELPKSLKGLGFTVLDGPFFSMMPFPAKGAHTLSHVRYTPRHRWHDGGDGPVLDPQSVLESTRHETRYAHMYADVVRHIPSASAMTSRESITEVKTVLSRSSGDDSRPILFSPNHGIANYTCIMGGKLDNIYDVLGELSERYD